LKHVILTILSILNPKERKRAVLLAGLDLLISVLDITFLAALLLIINFYTKGNAVNLGTLHIDQYKNSLWLIGVFFLLFSLKNWGGYLINRMQHSFFYSVASRLSRQNIWRYLKDDYSKFIHVDSSVLIRKINHQPIEFSSYILTNVQQIISQGMLVLFTIIAILFYHPSLFVLLFTLLTPPVVLLAWLIKRKLKTIRTQIKTTNTKAIQHLQEALSGYVESNIYNKNAFFTDRYYNHQQQLNSNIATQQSLQGLSSRLIEVFAVFGFFMLIAINKTATQQPAIDLLTIGVFMAASYKIIPGIVKILNNISQIKTYTFILNDLVPVMQTEVKTNTIADTTIASIKFDGVSFNYAEQPILSDFNLELSTGDFAGISGKSGLGKTTMINLLLGFLEQTEGIININNHATTVQTRKQYWPKIAYVKQQSFFINDTILKNIVLTDDGYDLNKLSQVLATCGIDTLVAQYPEGINKPITENGKNISGGQRQRIMLARALYTDFDLLILDEPFSEMDDAAEKQMLEQLQLLAQRGKIILLITHNAASLSYCNKLILLDGK
jgi:ABC-type multidrug transport system fused ATPase/permease subunit